ncbi:MAG: copper chaperone PCu(A)C [Candidatus Nanopelagicales bacterium]
MHVRTPLRAGMRATVLVALAAVLAACGSSTATSSSSATGTITAKDPWVKTAASGMTAAFVTLVNDSGSEDVLVSAASSAAGMVQLHEMVMQDGQMVMQEKKGGIPVPAKGEAVLEPGGNHIMLMELKAPIKVGEKVAITLTFSSGATVQIEAAARDYDGGNESYNPSPSGSTSGM